MQAIHNIPEICSQLGMTDVVMSPGSRCAPLTIAFAQHPQITERSIPDERSAAFIGMGMALNQDRPVALVCTSGTALLNYSPAVAEAFYQEIPLVILSADRPPEWTDQQDGQTIHQINAFGKHVKKSYQLPTDNEHPESEWQITKIISDAINLANSYPKGPVHVNIPLREPFYPNNLIKYSKEIKVIKSRPGKHTLTENELKELYTEIKNYSKILIIAGQGNYSPTLSYEIECWKTPVISEVISNLPANECSITTHDKFLDLGTTNFKPDLLITFGLSVLSKSLKSYLKKHKAKAHWHIQENGNIAPDTFQSLTDVINCHPEDFFKHLRPGQTCNIWTSNWCNANEKGVSSIKNSLEKIEFGEFKALKIITDHLPASSNLHLANSMAVRYANYYPPKNNLVYANRGTSGIDGSTSTCIGVSLSNPNTLNILYSGDLSFFYDQNALWNNYIGDNIRIVIFNNHGGGIFRMIDGPAKQKELEANFVVDQKLNAKLAAKQYGFNYCSADNEEDLMNVLPDFFAPSEQSVILEIETDGIKNTELFKWFKQF
jgi:2-succinyl-5-enolpyruvyl-6-hydroxy-3-cyclohexene-1-carboxylate synthase